MTETFSIDQLEREAQELRATVSRLTAEIDAARSRVEDIDLAVATLRRLSGAETPKPTFTEWLSKPLDMGTRKRAPSTDLVVELLRANPTQMTREQIHAAFAKAYPEVTAMWSNPGNALNNAISRAKARNEIDELDGYFFFQDFDDFDDENLESHA